MVRVRLYLTEQINVLELGGVSWGSSVAVLVAALSSSSTVLLLGPVVPHHWGLQVGKQLLQRMVFPRTGSYSPRVAVDAPTSRGTAGASPWAVGHGGWNTKELFLYPLVSLHKFILTKKQAATCLLSLLPFPTAAL